MTRGPSGANGGSQSPGQFECGPDFSCWVLRVVLQGVNGGNYMSLTLEVSSEPGAEEVLGAGPAAPGALARIVRD